MRVLGAWCFDWGKELDSIIVAIGNDDANPVSLKVGTINVDKPVVTNWHTAPKDAVPFGWGDQGS
ncbi:hypothetical protein SMICM304S_00801 [Streptomyces microflavus]